MVDTQKFPYKIIDSSLGMVDRMPYLYCPRLEVELFEMPVCAASRRTQAFQKVQY